MKNFSDVTSYLLATGSVTLLASALMALLWFLRKYFKKIDDLSSEVTEMHKRIDNMHHNIHTTEQVRYLQGTVDTLRDTINNHTQVISMHIKDNIDSKLRASLMNLKTLDKEDKKS